MEYSACNNWPYLRSPFTAEQSTWFCYILVLRYSIRRVTVTVNFGLNSYILLIKKKIVYTKILQESKVIFS